MKLHKCLDTTIVNRHELSDSPQAALAKNVMVIPVKSTQCSRHSSTQRQHNVSFYNNIYSSIIRKQFELNMKINGKDLTVTNMISVH